MFTDLLFHRKGEKLAFLSLTPTKCTSISANFPSPVNCEIPTVPGNGSIQDIQVISTVGGSQIFFRCNPRYVPAGRMSATCVSPDGISVVGTWTPDPADLVCNGELMDTYL